jgi:glycosyltransferase involved in cell wall biosynthesis
MRILLVNQHTVPVFADIAVAFIAKGHDVTLFAGHVEHGSRWHGDRVSVKRSVGYRRSSALMRSLSWLAFTAHYVFYLLFTRKPDHILVSTNPPLGPLVTRWIADMRSIPFHVLVYDLYPDALSQAGFVTPGNFLYRWWQVRNKKMFREANGVFTLSESMKVALSAYADESKVRVIPNWSDIDHIKPIPRTSNTFIRNHGLEGMLVVMYSGNMGLTHDLESVIEAATVLQDKSDLIFMLIGDGGRKKKLMEMTATRRLQNVRFLPYQDRDNFPLAVAAADIGIVTLGTGAEGISVPSKTYVNLAAGQCIVAICPPESELARIVKQYRVGFTVSPQSATELAGHIGYLLDHRSELAAIKARAREVSQVFTSDRAEEYVEKIFPSQGR